MPQGRVPAPGPDGSPTLYLQPAPPRVSLLTPPSCHLCRPAPGCHQGSAVRPLHLPTPCTFKAMERETSGCGEGGKELGLRTGCLSYMRLNQSLTQQQQRRWRRRRHSSPAPERTEHSSLMFLSQQRSDTGGRLH
ncbi:hypothetical protein JOB18_019620 [Solea senegalensis]|uniref:Uncharacterized protein n=1 Tax=Solea senegalensis TaxID=28829 RepID=A0AAV6SDV8_SOLSE|nr:hypothetical protein JOB18_019620 [Solea senegalensis]